MDLALAVFFWVTALCWLVMTLTATHGIVRLPALPPLRRSNDDPPAVSVIVAARDEAPNIEATVRHLLEQQHINLQIIAVDDRSDDGTGAILDRLEAEDPRLEVIHVDSLPDGWLGKPHALHLGAARASGAWLLFTDADITLSPDVIARSVQAATTEQADHVSLMPRQREATLLGKAAMIMLFFGLPDAFFKANRDWVGAGIGAFNLVRAKALHEIGGHEALRFEVLDDFMMANLLHRAGRRSRGYLGGSEVEMDLARTAFGVLRAVEKNAFAILRYSLLKFTALAVLLTLMLLGAVAGPMVGSPAGIAAGAAFLSLALPGFIFARRLRWPVAAGLLAPVGILIPLLAGLNSVVMTLLRRGVWWRGDFHRLEDLRRGMVRMTGPSK